MGMKNDTMAVMDPHAKVFGVQKLRVIHSPLFTFTPLGHMRGATCR
jgi:hypothetical protein